MAQRIANPWWMRADGARVSWSNMFNERLRAVRDFAVLDARALEQQKALVAKRPNDVQLRWACAKELGVPFGPFTVWIRPAKDIAKQVDVVQRQNSLGIRCRWGFVAAIIEVECTVVDPNRAVAAFATRVGNGLQEAVGAASVRGAAGARVTLRIRCSGANALQLVNGSAPVVRCQSLDEVVNDDQWTPLEIVGLPVREPWNGTAYDVTKQGMVTALTDPVSAALQRLERGSPPIGWHPLTETGRVAPTWKAPDPGILMDEIHKDLLPRITRIFRPGLTSPEQQLVLDAHVVDPPRRNGQSSSLDTTAELPPLALLALPAAANPFLALGTGFGTAYPADTQNERLPFGRADFLVTADYGDTPARQGPATMAAFIPLPAVHGDTPSPTDLTAERAGLVSPEVRDEAWRETVRVSWNRVLGSAGMARPTEASLARFDVGGSPVAECLLPVRAAGDYRPLLMVADGPEQSENHARTAVVDAAAVIPLGSGSRNPGYAVAVEDVFGVWSRWEDVLYVGNEPPPPTPRVLSLSLTSVYAGSTTCPATLETEIGVDWADRTPTRVRLAAVFFRMADAKALPPAGTQPVGPAPAGGFRLDQELTFNGHILQGPTGVVIEHLDSAGEHLVTPGPLQGEQGRRYRIKLPVPTLDFSATTRWGVQLWVNSELAVLPGATAWSPGAANPALANAASPVPTMPLPLPPLPGVPVGSTPDAQGQSHVRVRWVLPAGADVNKIVVWEVAESALRQVAGLSQREPEGTLPGLRLQRLRTAYDALPAARRRSAFRRLVEIPGGASETDITLPKGSTDIHLFAVTTVTSTGVESPWPDGPTPHTQLQAVAAPRLRRPAPPRVRAVVNTDGTVTIGLESPSRVPVQAFRLYRTRSAMAARNYETMGPAFATVTAIPPAAGSSADAVTGEQRYTASWSGSFAGSWDPWHLRAVAVPVDGIPEEAVRGQPSQASEAVTLSVLPDGPPDLAPLSAEATGSAMEWVLVRSSTSAPARALTLGSHMLSAQAGTALVIPIALEDIPEQPIVLGTGPATATPALLRAERAAGRTPLGYWVQRAVPTDPMDVVLRLVDPLGRVTEQRLTVPGHVTLAPEQPLFELIERFKITGRGVVFRLRCNAPIDVLPPYRLEVSALSRTLPGVGPRPFPPLPFPRPRPVSESFVLNEIRSGSGVFGRARNIVVTRSTTTQPHEYDCLVRLATPLTVTFTLVAPDGSRQQLRAEVR